MHSVYKLFPAILLTWTMSGCFAADWNYIRDDMSNGPSAWGTNFPDCSGDRNSPIDFNNANERDAEKWYLSGWTTPTTWTVEDTGYTVKFTPEGDDSITTDGGNLGDEFKVLQFHFHWGSSNTHGSEHTVGGKAYPMELHFVHQRSFFANTTEALMSEDNDGFAALGFFFELQEEDNPKLAKIVEGVNMVRLPANNETVSEYALDAIMDFVKTSINGNYFRYFGGLTTPACQEIVKWTVFETPIGISANQMAAFRGNGNSSYGTDFYRDVQPLGGRTLTKYRVNDSATPTSKPCSSASYHAAVWSISIFSMLALFL